MTCLHFIKKTAKHQGKPFLGHPAVGFSLLAVRASRRADLLLQYVMAVDAIEIYKLLPKIDCGQCPAKSCIAHAKAVAEDRGRLAECIRLMPYGLMLIAGLFSQGR